MTTATRIRQRSSCERRQRGLAMVEFAIVSPLLLLLLYAIGEFGNMLYQYALLADAARNADRYLSSNARTDSSGVVSISSTVVDATKSLVVYGDTAGSGTPAGSRTPLLPGLATGQVTVKTQPDAGGATDVTVSVAYPYQSLFGGSIPRFVSAGSINTTLTLNVFTSMRAL
jgi:Flp pilus assembly protein TadG